MIRTHIGVCIKFIHRTELGRHYDCIEDVGMEIKIPYCIFGIPSASEFNTEI